MTDLSQAQAGAQASASPEPLATPEQPTETKPLTIEDVRAEATRIAQSFVDKAENRISAKAQEQINALKLTQGALGLTDEQVETAANKIVLNDLKAPRAEQASTAPQTQTSQPAQVYDPAIQEMLDAFASEGLTISPTSPAYAPLDKILRDPNSNELVFRKELYKQVDLEKQRVAALKETAAARVVSGGQHQQGDANPSDSAHDLWEGVYDKK